MNDTIKSILKVLADGKPERRVAAAQILAELKPGDAQVTRAIAAELAKSETFLSRYLLEALAAIGTADATRILVERMRIGGPEADQISLQLSLGSGGSARVLASIYDDADSELRARIIAIVGRHDSRESIGVLRKALFSSEPSLADSAQKALAELAPGLAKDRRRSLVTQLKADVEKRDQAIAGIAQGLRALGIIDGHAARAVLLKFAGPRSPSPLVRQAALQALRGVELTPAQVQTVLGFVGEGDMTYVVRPAMVLLEGVEKWGAPTVAKLKTLLEGRREEVRRFALHALRNCNTEAVARVCLKFLREANDAYHEAAAEALSNNVAGLDILLKAFLREKDSAMARRLAVPLARLGPHFSPAHVKQLVERAHKQVVANDPNGDVTLSVLVDADIDLAMKELAERALRLRRAKKLADAQALLMRAAAHGELADEAQYQLAVCRLLRNQGSNGRDPSHAAAGNATMGHFTALIREGFPLLQRLKRESQMTPDLLLQLGSHFAESVGRERQFGATLLRHVADKHGRARAGEEAKQVLRAEGLSE